jgi:hypothetical protein
MREIIREIKDHVMADFHPLVYACTFLILTGAFIFNYSTGFVQDTLDSFWGRPICILFYILFFAFTWYPVAFLKLRAAKRTDVFRSSEFWIKSITIICLVGLIEGIDYRVPASCAESEGLFLSGLLGNVRGFLLIIIPFYFLYRYYRRENENFFGIGSQGFFSKPFFLMLLVMLPLIGAASFLPDFRETYPIFKTWLAAPVFGINTWMMFALFESTYVLDLLSVEWIFRGAMVIGMVAVMGRHAVLPMAVCYTCYHFGKPIGEAVSSFFGAYILGVVALRWKSIKGGFIVHAGVALCMDLFGFVQHYFR